MCPGFDLVEGKFKKAKFREVLKNKVLLVPLKFVLTGFFINSLRVLKLLLACNYPPLIRDLLFVDIDDCVNDACSNTVMLRKFKLCCS